MKYFLLSIFFLIKCQSDELVFKTTKYLPPGAENKKLTPHTYLTEENTIKDKTLPVKKDEKVCSSGCSKGEKCIDGICSKSAQDVKTLSDALKQGHTGMYWGIEYVDCGGVDHFCHNDN